MKEQAQQPDAAAGTGKRAREGLRILIAEDERCDRRTIRDYIDQGVRIPNQSFSVACMGQLLEVLRQRRCDVVIIDLGLPESPATPEQVVEEIGAVQHDVAIIPVSDAYSEVEAESWLQAGAQDFLSRAELSEKLLARAIGYVLHRFRDRQVQELTRSLTHYRELTSSGNAAQRQLPVRGAEPISQRRPEMFETALQLYRDIARTYMQYLATLQQKPVRAMEQLITLLGDPGGGPRDLVDIHVRVIEEALRQEDGNVMRLMTDHSRLLVLELMGMLVNYYRVGTRRR